MTSLLKLVFFILPNSFNVKFKIAGIGNISPMTNIHHISIDSNCVNRIEQITPKKIPVQRVHNLK